MNMNMLNTWIAFQFSEYSLSRLEILNVYISLSRYNARETTQLCEVQVKESMKKECNCSLAQVFLLFPIFQQASSLCQDTAQWTAQ